MPLVVGGVEFTVKVTVSRSVSSLKKLRAEFDLLMATVQKSRGHFSSLNRLLRSGAIGYSVMLRAASVLQRQLQALTGVLPNFAQMHNHSARAAAAHAASLRSVERATRAARVAATRAMHSMALYQKKLAALNNQKTSLANKAQAAADAIGGFMAILGARRLFEAVKDFTILAARVENLDTVMRTLGRTASLSSGELFSTEDRMKKLGITTNASREIIARFAQNNLEMADALKIARIAQDAAVVAGTNSSEAAERMTIAILRLDTRILRTLGLTINLRNEYQRYALATGRVENTLTALEKQQIVLNTVMRKGAALTGTYEKALQDTYKQFTSLDRFVEEASRTLGEYFIPVMDKVVKAITWVLRKFTELGESGSLLSYIVSETAGALLGLAAAASVVGFGALVGGFIALLGTLSPIALGVLAVGAAIGSLIAMFSNASRASEAFRRSQLRAVETAAYERSELRKLSGEISRLSKLREKFPEVETRLVDLRRQALALLTKEEAAVARGLKSYAELAAFLSTLQRRGISVSATDQEAIASLEKQIQLQESLKKLIASPRSPAEANVAAAELQKINDAIEILRAEQLAIQSVVASATVREVEKLEELANTAEQLALRVAKQLGNRSLKAIASDNIQAFVELSDELQQVAFSFQTLEQVEANYKAKLSKIDIDLQRDLLSLKRQLDATSDESEKERLQEEIAKLREASQVARESARTDREAAADQSVRTQKVLRDGEEELLLLYRQANDEYASLLARQQALQGGGAGTEVGEFIDDLRESSRDLVLSQDKLLSNLEELRMQYKGVAEAAKLDPANDATVRQAAALRERIVLLERLVALGPEISKVQDAIAATEFANAIGAGTDAIKEMVDALARTAELQALIAEGVPRQLAEALVDEDSSQKAAEDDIEKLRSAADKVRKERQDAAKAAAEAVTEEERIAAEARVKVLTDLEAQLADAIAAKEKLEIERRRQAQQEITDIAKDQAKERIAAAKEEAEKIADEQKKILDDVKERVEKTREKLSGLLEDSVKKTQDAQNFLLEKRFDIFGEQFGGQKAAVDAFREFRTAIAGAGTVQQTKQIQDLFISQIQKLQFEQAQKGNFGAVQQLGILGKTLFGDLQGAQRERAAEIVKEQEAIQRAKDEFELAKAQADAANTVVQQQGTMIELLTAIAQAQGAKIPGKGVAKKGLFDFGIGQQFLDAFSGADSLVTALTGFGNAAVKKAKDFAAELDEQSEEMKDRAKDIGEIRIRNKKAERASRAALARRGFV